MIPPPLTKHSCTPAAPLPSVPYSSHKSWQSFSQRPHITITVLSIFEATQSLVGPVSLLTLSFHSCHNVHIHYLHISFSSPETQLKVQWNNLMQALHSYQCTHKIFQQS